MEHFERTHRDNIFYLCCFLANRETRHRYGPVCLYSDQTGPFVAHISNVERTLEVTGTHVIGPVVFD